MAIYTVELNYTTAITVEVEAQNEGEALHNARELAEQAPMSSFSIIDEQTSKILNIDSRN